MITVAEQITEECKELRDMLVAKNKAYGNSALEPIRIFSKSDAVAQIKDRIDDKLSRIAKGKDTDAVPEDTELDLMGYLVLLRIARKNAATPNTPAPRP